MRICVYLPARYTGTTKTIDNFYSLFKNAPDNPEYIDMYKLVSKHSLKNNIIDKFKSLHLTATNKPKNLIKI